MMDDRNRPQLQTPRLRASEDGRIELTGDLTFATVGELYSQGPGAFDGKGKVRLDLGSVTKTDSAGLALLVEWLRRARKMEVQFEVNNMPEQMLSIARMSKLDALIFDEHP